MESTNTGPINANLRVPFRTEKEAEIAFNTLRVDQEPKRSPVTRQLTHEGNILVVEWSAPDSRRLRVSINSFMDLLGLVIDTIDKFGSSKT